MDQPKRGCHIPSLGYYDLDPISEDKFEQDGVQKMSVTCQCKCLVAEFVSSKSDKNETRRKQNIH